ncbi:MAG TPA: Sua5/YciO/YrdC/YwlC family protein, partial [Candidatus Thermoplasmatota archaeon]|nr:Sua5/YciO/YrdC/YwlC family protein [Candidatus Thermoplasmatota archaeon]
NLLGPRDTVAVRVPADPWAQQLAAHFGPLTATTAAPWDGKPPKTVGEAQAQLGNRADLYLDAGALPGTLSTIVDATGTEARVIRPGAIPEIDLVE